MILEKIKGLIKKNKRKQLYGFQSSKSIWDTVKLSPNGTATVHGMWYDTVYRKR